MPDLTIGFLGTGGIAEAMIQGMLADTPQLTPPLKRVLVTERSQERSARLARVYERVEVADPQAIVDQSEWVIVSVLPKQVPALLPTLDFRPSQTVLSVAAGHSVEALAEWVSPATRIHRLIPLPPIERRQGPIPIYPPDPELESFLNGLGDAVPLARESDFQSCSAASAIMASHFELTATLAKWMEHQGVPAGAAARYTTSMLHSLASTCHNQPPNVLAAMAEECLTPGGLNEQVLRSGQEQGWFDSLMQRLDQIQHRLSSGQA